MSRNSFMVVSIVLCLFVAAAGQTPRYEHPWEYGNVRWQDEQSQLNRFAQVLLNDSSMVGYIVVYAGTHSCPNEAKCRSERARKWVVKRGVPSDRVIAIDGGYRIEVQTILHLQPKGDPAYEPFPFLKKENVSIARRCVAKVFKLKRRLNSK